MTDAPYDQEQDRYTVRVSGPTPDGDWHGHIYTPDGIFKTSVIRPTKADVIVAAQAWATFYADEELTQEVITL